MLEISPTDPGADVPGLEFEVHSRAMHWRFLTVHLCFAWSNVLESCFLEFLQVRMWLVKVFSWAKDLPYAHKDPTWRASGMGSLRGKIEWEIREKYILIYMYNYLIRLMSPWWCWHLWAIMMQYKCPTPTRWDAEHLKLKIKKFSKYYIIVTVTTFEFKQYICTKKY